MLTATIVPVLMAAVLAQEIPIPKEKKPPRALDPLVSESIKDGMDRAQRFSIPLIVAVGMNDGADMPAVFRDPLLARSSRSVFALASSDYYQEDAFFKSRRIVREKVPCLLLLDPCGNVLDTQPADTPPAAVAASARAVRKLWDGLKSELPGVLAEAKKLAAGGDPDKLLAFLKPWLAKHLRGFKEFDELVTIAVAAGEARLKKAMTLPADKLTGELEKIAVEWRETPMEAAATLELAKLRDKAGELDEAKRLLKSVLDDMPWPENAAAHEDAKKQLLVYRKAEMERRKAEAEKK